jgi:curved DNA-binding protein CbpA
VPDLYKVLGVPPSVPQRDLRAALDRVRWTHGPNHVLTDAAREAYSILRDPRLRGEYDAGRVVSVVPGHYHQRREAVSAPPPSLRPAVLPAGLVERLAERFAARHRR